MSKSLVALLKKVSVFDIILIIVCISVIMYLFQMMDIVEGNAYCSIVLQETIRDSWDDLSDYSRICSEQISSTDKVNKFKQNCQTHRESYTIPSTVADQGMIELVDKEDNGEICWEALPGSERYERRLIDEIMYYYDNESGGYFDSISENSGLSEYIDTYCLGITWPEYQDRVSTFCREQGRRQCNRAVFRYGPSSEDWEAIDMEGDPPLSSAQLCNWITY